MSIWAPTALGQTGTWGPSLALTGTVGLVCQHEPPHPGPFSSVLPYSAPHNQKERFPPLPHIYSLAHCLTEKTEAPFGVAPIPGALRMAHRQGSPSLGHPLCSSHPELRSFALGSGSQARFCPRAQSHTCLWGSALQLSESQGRNSSVSLRLRPRVGVAQGQARTPARLLLGRVGANCSHVERFSCVSIFPLAQWPRKDYQAQGHNLP